MSLLCFNCRYAPDDHRQRSWIFTRRHDWGGIGDLSCSRCGIPLPIPDPTDAMLSKLIQLDRFGLGAAAKPLLECGWEGVASGCLDGA